MFILWRIHHIIVSFWPITRYSDLTLGLSAHSGLCILVFPIQWFDLLAHWTLLLTLDCHYSLWTITTHSDPHYSLLIFNYYRFFRTHPRFSAPQPLSTHSILLVLSPLTSRPPRHSGLSALFPLNTIASSRAGASSVLKPSSPPGLWPSCHRFACLDYSESPSCTEVDGRRDDLIWKTLDLADKVFFLLDGATQTELDWTRY